MLEALSFFNLDSEVWADTDGALAWAVRQATCLGDGSPPIAKPSLCDWAEVERQEREDADADQIEKMRMDTNTVNEMKWDQEVGSWKDEGEDVVAVADGGDSDSDDGLSPEQAAENMFLNMYDDAIEMALEAVDQAEA